MYLTPGGTIALMGAPMCPGFGYKAGKRKTLLLQYHEIYSLTEY